jgi:MinD superfamily P-loop ATPase
VEKPEKEIQSRWRQMSSISEKKPYKIAVASGKGGTGKTTVAVNLFRYLGITSGRRIQLVDCDVEEPNDTLFFTNLHKLDKRQVTQPVPVIDKH